MTAHAGDAGNVTADVRRGRDGTPAVRARPLADARAGPRPPAAWPRAWSGYGLGLLTESVLASLDPAMSVALAALGVLVGLDVA